MEPIAYFESVVKTDLETIQISRATSKKKYSTYVNACTMKKPWCEYRKIGLSRKLGVLEEYRWHIWNQWPKPT